MLDKKKRSCLKQIMALSDHSYNYRNIFNTLVEALLFEKKNIQYILVYTLLIGMFTVGASLIVQFTVNEISFTGQVYPLVILTILLVTLLTFAAIAQIARKILIELLQRRLLLRFNLLFADQLSQGQAFHPFEKRHLLAHRFFEIFNYQKALSVLLIDGVGTFLFMLLSLFIIVFYHPVLFFLVILMIIAFAIAIHVYLKPSLNLHYIQSNQKYQLAEGVEELLRNQRTLWPTSKRSLPLTLIDQRTFSFLQARENYFRMLLGQQSVLYVLEIFGAALFLGIGGSLVLNGQMQLGQLVAAESLVVTLLYDIAMFWKTLESTHDLVTASRKLNELIPPSLLIPTKNINELPQLKELKITHFNESLPQPHSWILKPNSIYIFQCPYQAMEHEILSIFFNETDQVDTQNWKIFWNNLDWSMLSPQALRNHIWLIETNSFFKWEQAGQSVSGLLQWIQQQWSKQGNSAEFINELLTHHWLPRNENPESWTQDERTRVALSSVFLPHTKSMIWISGLLEHLLPQHRDIFFRLCSRWLPSQIVIISDISWRYTKPEWISVSQEKAHG